MSETRPWGIFELLCTNEGTDTKNLYKVKRIIVKPGKRLSYQKHFHRSEHWVIVSGNGKVTLDGVNSDVSSGSIVDVAIEQLHRIENTGQDDLVFIEVQRGTSVAESDIVRVNDDFGRV